MRQLREKNASSQQELDNAEMLARTRSQELKSCSLPSRSRVEFDLAKAALVRSPSADADSVAETNALRHSLAD